MTKRNIIVDIDGVICSYDFPALIKKYFGADVKNKGIWTYSLEDALGLARSEVRDMFLVEAYAPPNMVPGACKTLKHFIDEGDYVLILSNRLSIMSFLDLEDWLEASRIPHTELITADDLPSYVHAQINDSPEKLASIGQEVRVKHSILFDSPWNRRCLDIYNRFERAKNWKKVKEIIDGY